MEKLQETQTPRGKTPNRDAKQLHETEVIVAVELDASQPRTTSAAPSGVSTLSPPSILHTAMGQSMHGKAGLVLLTILGFCCTVYLSTLAFTMPGLFLTGPLTSMQMCFFTLSFTSIIARVLLSADLWVEAVSEATHKHVAALSEIAMALLLYFFCDRTTVLPRRKKEYTADIFWMLTLTFCVAGAFTIKMVPKKPEKRPAAPLPEASKPKEVGGKSDNGANATESHDLLADSDDSHVLSAQQHPPSPAGLLMNRHQTDEWKGWMQMLFLWYHYYHNVSIYNSIRVFIAAYVWMTGFGNFTYYYNREDFSLHRFCGMMWRLNLFVICVCAILRNEYILYYICPLHTFFTLMVYVMLLVKRSVNHNARSLALKFVVTTVLCLILWDLPFSKKIFHVVFAVVTPLVRYDDPYNPTRDIYSEWFFRSFLDHYIWIVGMLVAYTYPTVEAWLRRLDAATHGPERWRALLTKWLIAAAAAAVMVGHYFLVLRLPKKEYNSVHPYTSFVPLLAFLVLRNISQRVRGCYVGLFEWFGKITLETYIGQYHVWMGTTGLNGSPHEVLQFVPGNYPLCDFLIGSVLMFSVSHRVAMATDVSKGLFFPPKASDRVLGLNLLTAVGVCAILVAAHWLVASLLGILPA